MPAQLVQERVGVVFRQVPELELEAAVLGNDVERRAPANGPRVAAASTALTPMWDRLEWAS
jgi:hypothetical protein